MSRTIFLTAALGATMFVAMPMAAEARDIERACNASSRTAATPQLCGCIQRVADQVLTRSDQRTAARFFADPDAAQKTRMSGSSRDSAFWGRYRAFGDYAGKVCSS